MDNPLEGVTLYSYGHSFTMYPAPYNTPYTGEYPERVRQRLKMGRGFFRGRSGTPLVDQIPMMFSDTIAPPVAPQVSRRWTPGAKGVVLAQHYMNELGGTNHEDPIYLNHWKQSLRTEFALMGSARVTSSDTATKVGTWTRLVTGAEWFWNGAAHFSSTVGSRIGFNVTGDSCWVLLANSACPYPTGMASISVTSDLTHHSDIVTHGKMTAFKSVHEGEPVKNYAPAAYKLTGLNALGGTEGTKSVWVEVSEAKNTFVSAVFIPAPNPPQIFFGFEPPRATLDPEVDAARRAAWRAVAEEVIAEFPYVHGVDLAPGWDNATMVGSLDMAHFHPNDLGMAHIADRFCEAISATITEPVDGVLVL